MTRFIFLLSLFSGFSICVGQPQTLLLSTARARVLSIDLGGHAKYWLVAGTDHAAVWISVTDSVLIEDSAGNMRETSAGEAHEVGPGSRFMFRGEGRSARLIVVEVKASRQPLTVSSQSLAGSAEQDDASSRNETLLIAISRVRLRDTLYSGNESLREVGSPRMISLLAGDVAWLSSPGIHRFANRTDQSVRFVSIEW